MNRWINRLFAWGTVLAALSILSWGVYLINKNMPRKRAAEVRYQPPMQPGTTLDHRPVKAGEAPDSKFIGGIGIVEPAGEAVAIGTELPGIVTAVTVRPGDHVRRGDPLFELDSRAAKAGLAIAKSNLLAAEWQLKAIESEIPSAQAKVSAAEAFLAQARADATNAQQQAQRAQALRAKDAISDEEFDVRTFASAMASARVTEAEAKLRDTRAALDLLAGKEGAPRLDVQRAAIEQARAAVAKEEVALDMHVIRAPLDATVLQVKIRVGEFAAAAVLQNALMILGVTDPLHVRVDIDESEIPRFQSGSKAYASVRGRPEVQVPIEFVRMEPYVIPKRALSGSVSERVDTRVLQVIYKVEPEKLQAAPGQQVDVYIEEQPAGQKLISTRRNDFEAKSIESRPEVAADL